MIFTAILAAAISTTSAPTQQDALKCVVGAIDQLAADPKQIAELRRWTRWEATRLLWSMAGDSPECAELFKRVQVTVDTSNAAYDHADSIVADRHLFRDSE